VIYRRVFRIWASGRNQRADFLLCWFSIPENGSDTFVPNSGSYADYTALYHWRWQFSYYKMILNCFLDSQCYDGGILTRFHTGYELELVEVKVILDRWSVGQSVLVSGHHQARNQFFFLLDIFWTVAGLLFCGALSDERTGLQFPVDAGTCQRSLSRISVQFFENPHTWRARSPYSYPSGTGWPSYTPGHWVPFRSSLTTRRGGGGILTRLHAASSNYL
jgi:hypothetical protein